MVKIEIDTAKDSPDEIRKIISYLQSVVGGSSDSSSPTESQDGIFNLFNNTQDDSSDESAQESPENDVKKTSDDAYIEIVEY